MLAQVLGGGGRRTARSATGLPWRTLGVDAVTGALVLGLWTLAFELGRSNGWRPSDPEAWRIAGASLALAVAVRRVAGVWAIVALVLAYPLVYRRSLASDFHLLPILVLAFAGAQLEARRSWAVVAAGALSVAVFFTPLVIHGPGAPFPPLGPSPDRPIRWRPNWSDLALAEFATVSVALLGMAIARQRATARDLAERNGELERLRRSDAERAVAEERLRISREVHDVVAHHLTAILMRAQAADRVRDSHPDEALDAVAWIAEESRAALRSTRTTVSGLRASEASTSTAPPDGLLAADLAEIVERVRQAGLPARLSIQGPGEPSLAPDAGLAVRRTVQEALTNVLKHAHATGALVRVDPDADGVSVRIIDDGTPGGPSSPGVPGSGAGLTGMRERAIGCGGRLRFGAIEGGGWQVHLWVPVAGSVT